ncbi:hypothetical protein D7V93_22215 [Corallococcus llansteffanensis]|uniref:Uncharacterized protein n=1 Tax=Corallococcus llansteffanensis TaxID=2316731 RepID=A0A3A8PLX4_9BACT|nr:hypothetical protein D7V93_22215 [Corallococcus llansteffanensis]
MNPPHRSPGARRALPCTSLRANPSRAGTRDCPHGPSVQPAALQRRRALHAGGYLLRILPGPGGTRLFPTLGGRLRPDAFALVGLGMDPAR